MNIIKIHYNIDLIYIKHHYDEKRQRPFNQNDFPFIKYRNQSYLSHYINQCSLLITDFSSICFDFMFMNKPSLFYLIDIQDRSSFEEKEYMEDNRINYFENVFSEQDSLIQRIKYYAEHNFKLEKDLKKKYESAFYYKNNITEKVVKIIEKIASR